MKNLALADALNNVSVVTAVKKEKSVTNKIALTQEQLQTMLKQAAVDAVAETMKAMQTPGFVPVVIPSALTIPAPRLATQRVDTIAHKTTAWVGNKAAFVEVKLRDDAAPAALAATAATAVVVASSTHKVSTWFTRLAERAAAKSLALTVQ